MGLKRNNLEAELEREVLLELGRAPDVALYRVETGKGFTGNLAHALEADLRVMGVGPELCRRVQATLNRHRIAWGLGGVGGPDLFGAVAGRALGLELKSPTGRVEPEQIAWHEAARGKGVRIAVVRSMSEARAAIEEARRG